MPREWSGAVGSHVYIGHPVLKVMFADALDVGAARDFNVVLCLGDIHAIKHGKETLSFQGNGKIVINKVK